MDNLYKHGLEISYSASCTVENITYFSNNSFNGLFSYDNESGEINFITSFSDEPLFCSFIHQKAFLKNNSIIFVPFHSGKLSIFSLDSFEIKTVVVNDLPYAFCIDSFYDNNSLWLFFNNYEHSVICMDLNDYSVKSEIHNKEIVQGLPNVIRHRIFYTPFSIEGNKIYGAIWGTNAVFCLDYVKNNWLLIKIDDKNLKLASISVCGKNIYFSVINSLDVYRYNIDTKRTVIYKNQISNSSGLEIEYPFFCYSSIGLLMIPARGSDVLFLNSDDESIEKMGDISKEFDCADNDSRTGIRRFFQFTTETSQIVIWPYSTPMKITLNLISKTINFKKLVFNRDFIEKVYFDYVKKEIEKTKGTIIQETDKFTFGDFVQVISLL